MVTSSLSLLFSVCGHLEMIDILEQQGSNLERPDTHSAYPIHYAAQMCGNKAENDEQRENGLKMLKKFIDKKVSLTCEDGDKRQPLLWAASSGMSF